MATRDLGPGLVRAMDSERNPVNRNSFGAGNAARYPAVVWGIDRRGTPHNVRRDPILRRQQEDMAQIWCPQSSAGSTRYRELFCAPILLAFGEPIAESQLDVALPNSWRHLGLATSLQRQVRDAGLLPLFVLDEVFPMSGIRTASLPQASNAVHARSPDELRRVASSWTRPTLLPLRRSTGFLFYLIGIHTGLYDESSYSDGTACNRIASEIERFVGAATGMDVTTQVSMFRRFFDGVFGGIWMYQDARLAQIASQVLNRADVEVCARIGVEVSRETHAIHLSLCADGADDCASNRFRLSGRPGDDPRASVARISAVLQKAGIADVTLADLEPRETRIAARASQLNAATRLALPL